MYLVKNIFLWRRRLCRGAARVQSAHYYHLRFDAKSNVDEILLTRDIYTSSVK